MNNKLFLLVTLLTSQAYIAASQDDHYENAQEAARVLGGSPTPSDVSEGASDVENDNEDPGLEVKSVASSALSLRTTGTGGIIAAASQAAQLAVLGAQRAAEAAVECAEKAYEYAQSSSTNVRPIGNSTKMRIKFTPGENGNDKLTIVHPGQELADTGEVEEDYVMVEQPTDQSNDVPTTRAVKLQVTDSISGPNLNDEDEENSTGGNMELSTRQ